MSNLYELTQESHHNAENTKLGKAIVNGTVTPWQYLYWLKILGHAHWEVDKHMPSYCNRLAQINLDIVSHYHKYYDELAGSQFDIKDLEDYFWNSFNAEIPEYEFNMMGAGYILLGAHLQGGPKNRKSLENHGFSCRHLYYDDEDRSRARNFLKELREMPQLAPYANNFFGRMCTIMDNI